MQYGRRFCDFWWRKGSSIKYVIKANRQNQGSRDIFTDGPFEKSIKLPISAGKGNFHKVRHRLWFGKIQSKILIHKSKMFYYVLCTVLYFMNMPQNTG